MIKLIYSEKATKFCEISNLLLSVFTVDKSKVEGDFAKFYGLLWIYELYTITSENSFKKFGSERPYNQLFQSEFFKSFGTKADNS